jgi:hypothetical protein
MTILDFGEKHVTMKAANGHYVTIRLAMLDGEPVPPPAYCADRWGLDTWNYIMGHAWERGWRVLKDSPSAKNRSVRSGKLPRRKRLRSPRAQRCCTKSLVTALLTQSTALRFASLSMSRAESLCWISFCKLQGRPKGWLRSPPRS